MTDQCPKCGAPIYNQNNRMFRCGTINMANGTIFEGYTCRGDQISRLTAERDELRGLLRVKETEGGLVSGLCDLLLVERDVAKAKEKQ